MLQRNKIRDPMETPEMGAASPHASEALKIEEILRRAREIHRQHGGMFGYDFEDWVQAWSARPERSSGTLLELADEMDPGLTAGDGREV
jgi:hypothetical protein